MSYPEPIYHGTEGEKSARYRPADAKPDWTYANGNTVHYLATGESTGGLFGLYRWEMGPEPSGPPAHFHKTITESFYVLTGTIKIYNGTEWIDTTPGDFVHVPAGGIHGFRNESGAPASMLLHFSPGAPREGYFEGIPDLGGMSEQDQIDFFLKHDNYWL
ncbi:mannose-6-phosphate isomerase-like protein (cupin superfamily) [Kibdelosporangium banguiense]|uniref:Mannose-6-phosphate isomerase-like protein (Cupin superfamily) n=1 Tax=Kibdelosporangium banguiense TaxID=1365924 RepID=A0ABS4T7L3_9PSEU|nr:cupin domain-containing protein [Kibdelosporangium banguiense]MBP2320286.1 mannose-6-phosphate isomerase-like protein (cupin superfamily) [Kibdelosporangium banguiense]